MYSYYITPDELFHHGIKGQKWGVRRYQYADGTRTPLGKKRERVGNEKNTIKRATGIASIKIREITNKARTILTGKQYADSYLAKGTSFKRIQTSKEFEPFAFYATYKDADSRKYMGLFGKNLTSRAAAEAKAAEKKANVSGSEEDLLNAKSLRERANNMKVYQLSIQATKKLKVPSDDNASDITANLLKDKDFRSNLEASITDSKTKMKRPTQQMLFNQAEKALRKKPEKMSKSEKVAVYKAFNLSLVNHNAQEVAAQDRFYSELKKKGYNALLDYNDKEYSSYHAKRPMIVFDLNSVKLQAVAETNPALVNKYYKKYNAERIAKEVGANTFGFVSQFSKKKASECASYVNSKMDKYFS